MSSLLIKNIGLLAVDRHGKEYLSGDEMAHFDIINDAWLLVEAGRIKDFGSVGADNPLPAGVPFLAALLLRQPHPSGLCRQSRGRVR